MSSIARLALGPLVAVAQRAIRRLEDERQRRRLDRLRALGLQLGHNVLLPPSTWIDESHCPLITIEDECGFGQNCVILAHDAQMNELLDATRLGRVIIRRSCHIGAGSIILPGVELGPRTLVGAGSVVSRSLPAETVCAGAPARVICSLEEYLERHRAQIQARPRFEYDAVKDVTQLTEAQREALRRAVADGDAYIVGPICAATLAAPSVPMERSRS